MISSTVPSSVRKGAAVAGVAGLLVLAGCSGTADADVKGTAEAQGATATEADSGAQESSGSGEYVDGTYTAKGAYQTPETVEQISVMLRLEDGVITDVTVTGDPQARESEQYQGVFITGIAEEVVGVAIHELNVSRVAGSSLTSGGFNSAVDDIKEQAAV
ncbi:FMN-binding protein [Microbacterium sp. A93]|uniref:FMN-binding protein n=1 Tax=unclassified Microbacterium TaxID=2609290 RepID=UPI003F41C3D4